MSKAVGEEIRRRRLAKGWGQTKLAAEAGMAVSGISQLENGKHNPTSATLEKVARALGVEIGDLFPKAPTPLQLEFAGQAGQLEENPTLGGILGGGDLVSQYEAFLHKAFRRVEAGEGQEGVVREHASFLEKMSRDAGEIGFQVGMASPASGESSASGEEHRLINALAPAVIAAEKGWERYLEQLPEQPTAEVWKKESEHIKELLDDAFDMYEALKEHGVLETMEPYVAAIEAGESVFQPLRRNVIGLYNALAAMFVYTIPEARNWANRFEERVQSENIDRMVQEWAMKEPILETDIAQKND